MTKTRQIDGLRLVRDDHGLWHVPDVPGLTFRKGTGPTYQSKGWTRQEILLWTTDTFIPIGRITTVHDSLRQAVLDYLYNPTIF